MLNGSLKIESCSKYKYPHGAVYIGSSNETLSCGFLEILPGQATNKLAQPLPEHVKQISGVSEIEMFDELNRVSIKRLNPGETFIIPTNMIRVHRNREITPAINYWEYQGNATALIAQIRAEGLLDETWVISQPAPSSPPKL